MKKVSQYTLAILFFALIFELVIIGPLDLKEEPVITEKETIKPEQSVTSSINQSMSNIHVIETKNENKEWELWADTAIGFKNQENLDIKKVKVNFFSPDGVSFDVTGDSGAVTTGTKNLKIDGGVLTKSSNGYSFKTNRVEYNSQLRTLKSETHVEVDGPKDKMGHTLLISGNQMNADLNQGLVTIENNVRARKSVQNNKNMTVSANKVQLSGKERAMRFTGDVVIEMDGVNVSGPDALFNYDKETHQLNSIDLSGGVKVSDLSKWATSDNLKINLAKNEFIFDGQPRVVQDDDELRGDRIIFLDGGKKVKVQNAKIKVSKDSLNSNEIRKAQ
jgi:LPS export ABC transporter protein LptC